MLDNKLVNIETEFAKKQHPNSRFTYIGKGLCDQCHEIKGVYWFRDSVDKRVKLVCKACSHQFICPQCLNITTHIDDELCQNCETERLAEMSQSDDVNVRLEAYHLSSAK